jgi:hypothetical protein
VDDFKWPLIALVLSLLVARAAKRYRWGAKWSVFRRRVSKVSAGREGLVRVQGRAAPVDGSFVCAPISGASCLFYDCVVDDNSDDSPRQVRREYRGVWFQIDDGTGMALIKFADSGQTPAVPVEFDGPPGVSCAIPLDRKAETADALRAAVERTHVIRAGDDVPRNISAREGCLMPGDHVSVVGFASFERDPSTFGRRDPPLMYVVAHAPDTPLVIASRRAGR